jgi:hypothetical protein
VRTHLPRSHTVPVLFREVLGRDGARPERGEGNRRSGD